MMPFRLTNAPATFQSTLDLMLSRFDYKTFLIYLKYIIIFSNSIREHIGHKKQILTDLKEAVLVVQ